MVVGYRLKRADPFIRLAYARAYRLALRWEAGESVTVDYAFDKSQLDEANTPQVAFGLTPARISQTVVARETAVQGYVNEGNLALQGQGPLAPAAGDPNFVRWLGSSNALLNAFSTEIGDGDRPGSAYADVKSNTTSQSAGHSLIATWQVDDLSVLGDVEFKSITGWRKVNSRNQGYIDGFNNKIPPVHRAGAATRQKATVSPIETGTT